MAFDLHKGTQFVQARIVKYSSKKKNLSLRWYKSKSDNEYEKYEQIYMCTYTKMSSKWELYSAIIRL